MLRYVALVWDPVDPSTQDQIRTLSEAFSRGDAWTRAYQTQGLLVYTLRKPGPVVREYGLPDGRGIVLGRLFEQGTHSASAGDAVIDSNSASRYVASGGAELVKDYWGGYVAFLVDATNCRLYGDRKSVV